MRRLVSKPAGHTGASGSSSGVEERLRLARLLASVTATVSVTEGDGAQEKTAQNLFPPDT